MRTVKLADCQLNFTHCLEKIICFIGLVFRNGPLSISEVLNLPPVSGNQS
jgi:hypothetical protein